MLSLNENPPIKPDAVAALGTFAEVQGEWFVGHTKSRNEKAFAWELVRRDVPFFLPMVEKVTFSGGRKRRNMAALFPGYVFFAGDGETRYQAMTTGRLCQVIEVTERQQFVEEIQQIDRVLGGGGAIDFFPHTAVGNRVRIIAGPYEGNVGTVVDRGVQDGADDDDSLYVVISVTILGVGAGVKVPPSQCAPADASDDLVPVRPQPKFQRIDAPERVVPKPEKVRRRGAA
jgi:hypothetical protein